MFPTKTQGVYYNIGAFWQTHSKFVWTGGGGSCDGVWSTAACWFGRAVPGASDTAIFDGTCTSTHCSPTQTGAINVGGIDITQYYTGTITLDGTHTLTVGASGFYMDKASGFAAGTSNWTVNGTVYIGYDVAATISSATFGTGTATITTLNLYNSSTLNLSSGTLNVSTGATCVSGGNCTITGGSGPITISGGTTMTTFTASSGTTTLNGTTTISSTFTHNSGTLILGGTASTFTFPSATTFNNLQYNATSSSSFSGSGNNIVSGTLAFGSDGTSTLDTILYASGNITVTNLGGGAGTLYAYHGSSGQTVTINGGTLPDFTLNKSNASDTVVIAGSAGTLITGNLTVTKGDLQLGGNNATLSGNMTVGSNGTLDASSGTPTITINDADFNITGTFTCGTSSVVMNRTTATIRTLGGTASPTFYNFSISSATLAGAPTVQFEAGATFTVTHTLNFTGNASSHQLRLRSTTGGTQWKIAPSSNTNLGADLNVQDSNNTGGHTLTAGANSTGSTQNNTNWAGFAN